VEPWSLTSLREKLIKIGASRLIFKGIRRPSVRVPVERDHGFRWKVGFGNTSQSILVVAKQRFIALQAQTL
jgi:hypothetical protein